MSATDELRRLLDERDVKYEAYRDIKNRCITRWRTYHGAFVFFAVEKEGELFVETASDTEHSAICTPEQAIAATLGSEFNPDGLPVGLTISDDSNLLNWRGENYVRQSAFCGGKLTAEQVSKATYAHSIHADCADADWQAIADELTAERDNLKDDLIDERGKLNRKMNALREVTRDYRNERDHYREKFGKCIDYADAIHALMDDEGLA